MIDVHLPIDDGRTVILSRYTQPEKELQMLLEALRALNCPTNLHPASPPKRKAGRINPV
jgi:hypothetical protein